MHPDKSTMGILFPSYMFTLLKPVNIVDPDLLASDQKAPQFFINTMNLY